MEVGVGIVRQDESPCGGSRIPIMCRIELVYENRIAILPDRRLGPQFEGVESSVDGYFCTSDVVVKILTPFTRDESIDFFVEIDIGEGDCCKDDMVRFYIKGDGVSDVYIGASLAAVPLRNVPRGVRMRIVPFDISVEVESFFGGIDDPVRKIDALEVEIQ